MVSEGKEAAVENLAKPARFRHYGKVGQIIVSTLAIGLALYVIAYTARILTDVGIYLTSTQFVGLFLAWLLTLDFLMVPPSKKASRKKLPWYDMLLILASLPGPIYMFLFGARIDMGGAWASPTEIVLGSLTIVVVCEATRRSIGWAMVIIALLFFFYGRFCYLLPGALHGPKLDWPLLLKYVFSSVNGIFSNVLTIGATIITVFCAFGAFLEVSGAGKSFTNLATGLVGRFRGGPAKVAVVGSSLLGTMSGSPVANIAVVGAVTIPLMKKTGYTPLFAGAVESVASTGGALMPPIMSATAFVMASFTGISYGAICLAAIVPAILYYLCLFCQVDFRAAKLGLRGLPANEIPSMKKEILWGWHLYLPLAVLVVLLIVVQYDPPECAVYAIAACIVVSWFRKETRIGPRKIVQALRIRR